MSKSNSDTAPIMLRKITANKFELVYQYDEEETMHLAIGSVVECRFWQQRSMEHLALYWVILRDVVSNSDIWPRVDDLHEAIKMSLGYKRDVKMLDGSTFCLPGSISIRSMDQANFKIYFERAMNELREAGYPVDDYLAEANRMTERREQKPIPYHKGRFDHGNTRTPP